MEPLLAAGVSILVAAATAWITTHFRMKEERLRWNREFTLKLAEMQSEDESFLTEVSTQLAIGLVIHENPSTQERDRYFLPPNFRGVVGRGDSSLICISDQSISRQHCAFTSDNKSVYVEDFGSSNATYLNGKRVGGREKLTSGDAVDVGGSRLVFHELKPS